VQGTFPPEVHNRILHSFAHARFHPFEGGRSKVADLGLIRERKQVFSLDYVARM
jgi:hypothetical protein